MRDSRTSAGPALVIGNENNARTQINLQNVACKNVPVLASFRESGKTVAGQLDLPTWSISSPTACTSAGLGADRQIKTTRVGPRGDRPAGAGGLGHPRPARPGHLGQRPNARRDGRRQDRRHRGSQEGDCGASNALSAHGLVLRQRHADAPAGHRADRPASLGHRDQPAGQYAGVPGRRRAQGGHRDPQGRDEHRHRHRRLYQRDQSPRRRRQVDGRGELPDERRPPARRARHARPRPAARRESGQSRRLGQPVRQPLGHRRRRRDLQGHLDAESPREVRHAHLGHLHERPGVRDVAGAPRQQRDDRAKRLELAVLRGAVRGGAGGRPQGPAPARSTVRATSCSPTPSSTA